MSRTRFAPSMLRPDDPDSVRKYLHEVEQKQNEEFWIDGSVPVVTLGSEVDGSEPAVIGGGEATEGNPWPIDQDLSGGLSAPRRNQDLGGSTIRLVDAPLVIRKVAVTVFRQTEGSTGADHLEVRARDWARENWLGPVLSSLDGEFSPNFKVVTLDGAKVTVDAGVTVGAVCARIGQGPAWHPPQVRVHLLVAYV